MDRTKYLNWDDKSVIHFSNLIGSGRVTFCSHKSYMKAVNAAFVEIKNPKFVKKVRFCRHRFHLPDHLFFQQINEFYFYADYYDIVIIVPTIIVALYYSSYALV